MVRATTLLAGLFAALLASLPVGGCTDYLARRDTLILESGDAVQANIARQVIDPWSREGRQLERTTDGERAQHAVERYRNPQAGAGNPFGAGLPPPPSGVPVVPPAGALAR